MFGPIETPHRLVWARSKHSERPEEIIFVGSPSKWSPPWGVKELPPDEMVRRYESYLLDCIATGSLDLSELTGFNLACRCPLDVPCHADVLLKLANRNRSELEALRRRFIESVEGLMATAEPMETLAQKALLGKTAIESIQRGKKADLPRLCRLALALDAELVVRRPVPPKKPVNAARIRQELEASGVIFDDRRGRAIKTAGPVELETLLAVLARLADQPE